MKKPEATLRLHIDTEALASNWQSLDRLSGAAAAGAAVKADAYGLGVGKVMPVLLKAGTTTFFVAHWSEVEAVLAHTPASTISVLHGAGTEAEANYAKSVGVKPVINSPRQAQLWQAVGGGLCDIMIDTGINRLGLTYAELSEPVVQGLAVDTALSHLASADEDCALNAVQLQRSKDAFGATKAKRFSLSNSAGIALGTDYHFDLTRPGLALYGGVPRPELAPVIRQVATPQAAIIQTRRLSAGDGVGYNSTYVAHSDMRIGLVSLGYADGFIRCWGRSGYLLHGEQRLPLLGKVSMDMIAIDLTNAPDQKEGDWLSAPYALPEASELTGLSQYELLTLTGPRLRG